MTTHIKDDFGNDWYFEDAQHHVADETEVTTGDLCRDALQSIITWADFAMKNKDEFDSHGVSLLDGPIFDKARAALANPAPQPRATPASQSAALQEKQAGENPSATNPERTDAAVDNMEGKRG